MRSGEVPEAPVGAEALGRKIAVYGAGGKTTLAASIAAALGIQHIQTDEIHHLPAWQSRPLEDARALLKERLAAAKGGWVVDGNYAELRPEVLPLIDTAIVIQLPFRVMAWRIFKRTVRRARTRERIAGGNRESWRLSFASRDSILLEIWQKRQRFRQMGETIRAELRPGTKLHVLRSARQLDDFYGTHGLVRR